MQHGWGRVAERFEEVYDRVTRAAGLGRPR
jgi:hypothetical protein